VTPKAFLARLREGRPAAGYLFLGNELFYRDRCRQALRQAALGSDAGPDAEGRFEIDLRERPLLRLIEEARTLSLFAKSRLILGLNAESALPRAGSKANDGAGELERYFADPTPGVVVAFECTRYDPAERDDRAKLERVAAFYRAVPESVEMPRPDAAEALRIAKRLAAQQNLEFERDGLAELVEMLGADLARIERELEKLALYVDEGRPITKRDLEDMVPEARQSGAYALSDAIANRDQRSALETIDALARSGAYWPMQLTFLGGLLRQTLAAKEVGGDVRRIQAELTRAGQRIWPSRARQLADTARFFSRSDLEKALEAIYEADRDLRRERPDDRLIIERLALRLTGG